MNVLSVSADAQALLMLASPLGRSSEDPSTKRFSLREWNDLARAIAGSDVRRPGGLLGLPASEIRSRVGVSEDVAERVARLLSRGVELALEVERLQARGIWVVTRADDGYPAVWRERLKERAPVAVFGVGNATLLTRSDTVAIVGSRDVDEQGIEWTIKLAERCALESLAVISGAARGVDRTAMAGALKVGGEAVGIVAESLAQMIRNRELRDYLNGKRLALVSANHPDARFTPGTAMERNKYIYSLGRWAVVVSSAAGEGGTWTGAVENLKAGWVPLFVRNGDRVPAGNLQLLAIGAVPIRLDEAGPSGLREWLTSSHDTVRRPQQPLLVRETAALCSPRDAFEMLWPELRAFLVEPRTETEVASAFHLEKIQMRKWLQRALDEGRVEKLKRPARFRAIAPQDDRQPGLFEAE